MLEIPKETGNPSIQLGLILQSLTHLLNPNFVLALREESCYYDHR